MSDLRTNPAAAAQAIEEAAALYRQGKLDAAEKICARVLRARPDWFDALHLLGLIKLQAGKPAAALGFLESALKLNPDSPLARSNLGMTLAALNRDSEALAVLDKALALLPTQVEAITNRGNVLLKLNRPDEALAAFEQAVAIEPRFLGALLNRGNALVRLGRLSDALAQYDAVLVVAPTHAETHVNRGNTLSALGRALEAIAAYERALALRPDYIKALIGRGAARQALNRHREALADFERVIAIDKTHADAHNNAALVLLTLGDFRRGFAEHEWRWQRTGMPARRRSFGKPLWLGEYPLTRKRILLHAEQGLGDCIQFVRYVPALARMGATVLLEAPPALAALFARVEGVDSVVAQGAPLPAFDVHCPLGSLPHALRTEPSSIPAAGSYLTADAERLATWRARLDHLPSPRVAIAWSGNADHANDRNRSMALARLAPLFSRAAGFISIQRDLRSVDAEELARLSAFAEASAGQVGGVRRSPQGEDGPQLMHVGPDLQDFDDTAAVVALADLVISVDTAVAHLAGALGRPTWVLLPFSPDWRWMLEREDSPWYPSMRLFRQPAAGDWDAVIARVREELARI